MHEHTTDEELNDRLSLIENMIFEGRHTTESWGWCFVLWGLALYVAIAWSLWGQSALAWPVTMTAAVAVNLLLASFKRGNHPATTLGRAIGCVWIAGGISMFVLFVPLGMTGRLTDTNLFIAVLSAILGMANGVSGLVLRWKVQCGCAVIWWAAVIASCYGSQSHGIIVFIVAIFLGQISFGIYGMFAEAQGRKRHRTRIGTSRA